MLLRILIFLAVICAAFPFIYKIIKKLFIKYNQEFCQKTTEDYVNEVDISKENLKDQIDLEESLIKSKNKMLNKVKGKVK